MQNLPKVTLIESGRLLSGLDDTKEYTAFPWLMGMPVGEWEGGAVRFASENEF